MTACEALEVRRVIEENMIFVLNKARPCSMLIDSFVVVVLFNVASRGL